MVRPQVCLHTHEQCVYQTWCFSQEFEQCYVRYVSVFVTPAQLNALVSVINLFTFQCIVITPDSADNNVVWRYDNDFHSQVNVMIETGRLVKYMYMYMYRLCVTMPLDRSCLLLQEMQHDYIG